MGEEEIVQGNFGETAQKKFEVEKREFQNKYPFGKAEFVDFQEPNGHIRNQREIAEEITDLINQRGRFGYQVGADFSIPTDTGPGAEDSGRVLVFKKVHAGYPA